MVLRVPQTNLPTSSVTDSAISNRRRIVSTRPTRRAAISPQRSPQYDRTRITVRDSPAASDKAVTCSWVRNVFSGFPALGSFTPMAGLEVV